MHWLTERVARLGELVPEPGAGAEGIERRRAFLAAVASVVEEAANRDGVDAAFASFEGLLVAVAGRMQAEAEPMAALAQSTMDPLHVGTLGSLRQILLVGADRKLALIRVGPVTVGLLSPADVRLAAVTAAPARQGVPANQAAVASVPSEKGTRMV